TVEGMATLAVGVVGEDIEEGDPEQLGAVGLDQGFGVALGVVVDVPLDGANPVRPVPNDGWRNEMPTKRLGDEIRGVLTLVEGAVGKVPEGNFSPAWLIDREPLLAPPAQRDGEAIVRA